MIPARDASDPGFLPIDESEARRLWQRVLPYWHRTIMALARVVLHVGPPKTGTTSIQAALTASRRQLLEAGVYYPPTQPESLEGQPSLAWDVLEECGKPVERLSRASVSWDESLLGAERAGAHTLLVSSEDFSSDAFDGTAFLQLRRRLVRLPIDVVFALRDPRRLAPSIWAHSVRWGIGCGEELLSLRDAVPLILGRRNVQVIEFLKTLEDSLQPAQINFLTVPRRNDRTLILERFAQSCGLPRSATAGILATADSTENAALPLGYVQVLLSINRAMNGGHTAPRRGAPESFGNRIEVRRCLLGLLERDAARERPHRAALPEEFRSAAEDLAGSIRRWVEARSAPVYGDLRDVWDDDERDDRSDSVAPALTQAEIDNRALRYLAETASELQNTVAETEKARDFWRDRVSEWENACLDVTSSWSWKLTKPLRVAGPLRSLAKLLHRRNG